MYVLFWGGGVLGFSEKCVFLVGLGFEKFIFFRVLEF